MFQIFVLSFTPRQLLSWITRCAIRAGFHGCGHSLSEKMADRFESRQSALILECIMQQGCDCLILVAASLKHQRAHAHQMGNVGNGTALSGLVVVEAGSELQRKIKSPRQEGDKWFHDVILRLLGPGASVVAGLRSGIVAFM